MIYVSTVESQYGTYTITDNTTAGVGYGTITVTGPLDHLGGSGTLCVFKYIMYGTDTYPNEHSSVLHVSYHAALVNATATINRKIQDISETVSRNVQIEIRDIDQGILDNVIMIRNAHNDIRDDIRALKTRGVDENLGIVTRETCVPCENGFYGALIRNAVVQSKQVKNIQDEYYHPTNIVPGA
jgi:hypothetical protein